jgi:hypothetical protein
MVSLGKQISNVKLIRKILKPLLEHFRIKVTTIEESKDLEEMKIKELVGSLQTYEYSLPPVRKARTIALKAFKASKKKSRVSSDEDSDIDEDAVAMLAKNFERFMKNNKFKKKVSNKLRKAPHTIESEEAEKKDLRGPQCFECSSARIILQYSVCKCEVESTEKWSKISVLLNQPHSNLVPRV